MNIALYVVVALIAISAELLFMYWRKGKEAKCLSDGDAAGVWKLFALDDGLHALLYGLAAIFCWQQYPKIMLFAGALYCIAISLGFFNCRYKIQKMREEQKKKGSVWI